VRYPFSLLLVAVLLTALTCSDSDSPTGDISDPSDNDTASLIIAYAADPDHTISRAVSAEAGDTLELTDGDGIVFRLGIPPGALPLDTTITMAAIGTLEINGPSDLSCSGCGDGDSLCCFRGVLLEPEGLVFDSAVSLAITFPPGTYPYPDSASAGIAWFDSTCGYLGARSTVVDTATNTLECTVDHFSGYMTWEWACPMFEHNYKTAAAALFNAVGAPYVIYWGARDLYHMGHSLEAEGCGLTGKFDSKISEALSLQVSFVSDYWGGQPASQEVIGGLVQHLSGFQSIELMFPTAQYGADVVAGLIDSKLREIAEAGHQLCLQGNTEGKPMLDYVAECGAVGLLISSYGVPDIAYLQQVIAWANACGGDLTVSMTASNTRVQRCVLVPDDMTNGLTVCSLTVKVTDAAGEAREGLSVRGWLDKGDGSESIGLRGSTDENGEAVFALTARGFNDQPCATSYTWTYLPQAYEAESETWFSGNSISVTFVNLMIETNLTYNYTTEGTGTGHGDYSNAAITIEGGGHGPARESGACASSCFGELERDFSADACVWVPLDSELQCSQTVTVDAQTIYACRALPDFGTINIASGVTVEWLRSIRVTLGEWLMWGIVVERSAGAVSIIDTLGMNDFGGELWPESTIVFELTAENGTAFDTTWLKETTEPFIKSANLNLSVSAFH